MVLYAAMGPLYVRWTAASILSLIENTHWTQGIGVVVSRNDEKNVLNKLFPQIWCESIHFEVSPETAKYFFKLFSLGKIPFDRFPKYENILFLDCDVFGEGEVESLLEKIDGKFWIDEIFNHKKIAGSYYEFILKDVAKGENIALDPNRVEYNSGLWSVSYDAFKILVKEYAELTRKYYLKYTTRKPIGDQIFLAPAAVKIGLKPFMIEGKYKTYAYTSCKHYDIGLNHFAGDWRCRKTPWQARLKTSGIEEKLIKLTKKNLSAEEFKWLWDINWDRDQFLGKADLPFWAALQSECKIKQFALAIKFKSYAKVVLNKFALRGK